MKLLEEQHAALTTMRAELHAVLLEATKRGDPPAFVALLHSCRWYMDATLERLATLLAMEATP